MTRKLACILGALLITAGIAGFIVPEFMGAHHTPALNLIYTASGALTLYFGAMNHPGVRTFCKVLGTLYVLLGVVGLIMGGTDAIWTAVPQQLVFVRVDHIAHLVLGGLLLLAGMCGHPVGVSSSKT